MSNYSFFFLYKLLISCFLPILKNASVFYLDPSALSSEEKGTIDNPYKTIKKIFQDLNSNDLTVSIYIMNDLNEIFFDSITVQNEIEINGYNQNQQNINSENLRFIVDGGRLEIKYLIIRSKNLMSFTVLGNGSFFLKVKIFILLTIVFFKKFFFSFYFLL